MPAKGSRGPWLWPLGLAAVGVVLLLHNFLLLENFNVTALWPLLLVVAGAGILLRGDLIPSAEARTFGITRGSVESATLEISAGDIDVSLRALQREGRLIAGQYAGNSRPFMSVNDTHTYLRMDRAATPWYSLADWEMGLAGDLPWQILISTHLGNVNFDLSGLILQEAVIATGIGDIRLTAPRESLGPVRLHSTLGNIHLITPVGYRVMITNHAGGLFRVHADDRRYEQPEPGLYVSLDADASAPLVEITLHGTFGDAYLT
ncbi:MAG: hypothetical protein HZC41_14235 [Chloroflexi bacterium]|nr:hypothetical protein [Chloroflexota bacterium]